MVCCNRQNVHGPRPPDGGKVVGLRYVSVCKRATVALKVGSWSQHQNGRECLLSIFVLALSNNSVIHKSSIHGPIHEAVITPPAECTFSAPNLVIPGGEWPTEPQLRVDEWLPQNISHHPRRRRLMRSLVLFVLHYLLGVLIGARRYPSSLDFSFGP
ncbi:hypothetical protein FPQ18DRAFT_73989 [Pyronema domesticum]|nr:hypothetical protein FPQ18DRAFT_73989 [Pyronema domesticum]